MTTETKTGAKSISFYATDEDQEYVAAVAAMLRQHGHRVRGDGVTAAISYALRRVFLTECSTDGAMTTERNAA